MEADFGAFENYESVSHAHRVVVESKSNDRGHSVGMLQGLEFQLA